MRFAWDGGRKGTLRVAGTETSLASAQDILAFARGTGGALDDKQLRFLGIATFFAAFRELGHFAAAERELDALDPVLQDADATTSFQNGIADVKLHLFPRRSEHRHVLLDAAFAFMLARLDELRA